jgi:hypothetical protein
VTAEPTSDFSVCTTCERKWYLLDVYRARLEYPELKRKVIALRDQWRADRVVVEKANTGYPLCQEFQSERLGRLELYTPRDDKETRFEVQTDDSDRLPSTAPKQRSPAHRPCHDVVVEPCPRVPWIVPGEQMSALD